MKRRKIDASELDQLINDGTPSSFTESDEMTKTVSDAVLSSGSVHSIDVSLIRGLDSLDVFSGSAKTAGLILAAAAMGVAHANGERVVGWPSFDAITARSYWQKIAKWTDEEYSRAVVEARERAAHGHARIILEISKRASFDANKQSSANKISEVQLVRALHTELQKTVQTVRSRVSLVTDSESCAMYSSTKYSAILLAAGLNDYVVYYCREGGKVRHNHKVLHGKSWLANSPVWRRILPPNGYKCRCVFLKRSFDWVMKNLGKDSIRTTVPVDGGPDPGFSNDPRSRKKTDWSKYKDSHVTALMRTQR